MIARSSLASFLAVFSMTLPACAAEGDDESRSRGSGGRGTAGSGTGGTGRGSVIEDFAGEQTL